MPRLISPFLLPPLTLAAALMAVAPFLAAPALRAAQVPFPVVDTNQAKCYGNDGEITAPKRGAPFFGQDAQNHRRPAEYALSSDGLTVSDKVTGLVWQRSPDTDGDGKLTSADKLTFAQAQELPAKLNAKKFGGRTDWRLPDIKTLYSLFDARGTDPGGEQDESDLRPFIDQKFFRFAYGDTRSGERIIDSQYASATKYVGKSARGGDKVFGVNFADGRIKGYDRLMPGRGNGGAEKTFFVLCVAGNPAYGKNAFVDNRDGTVTDRATGLMWEKGDSGKGMNWKDALAWAQQCNAKKLFGHADWRVPSVKELQSLVDYTRSPDTSDSPAIDPLFTCTAITNENGKPDYPFYWSSTTHVGPRGGRAAMYVSFGRACGWLTRRGPGERGGPPAPGRETREERATAKEFLFADVHGAGAQRSDPKEGDAADYPHGHGPQGDVIRILNAVRLVRDVR